MTAIPDEDKSGQVDVWWSDPTLRPLPVAADVWDKGMRASYAPIQYLPPLGCRGPVACSRLGPCDRQRTDGWCQSPEDDA